MPTELEELKRLTPEERVSRLKALEERRKKEIEEAHRLLQDSINEIEEKKLVKFNRDAARAFDESTQINLEQTIGTDQLDIPVSEKRIIEEEQHAAYIGQLSAKPIEELSNQRQYLASQAETGHLDAYNNQKALGTAYALREAAEAKLEYFASKGDVTPSGYIAKIHAEVDAASSLIDRLKRDYER